VATVTIEDAQARLAELIEQLRPGEDIIITQGQQPVARLTMVGEPKKSSRQPGTLKSTVFYMAPDFDAPLEDFKEYME
jgi:prevent-host-death family protein